MAEKELRKMSRAELIEIIYALQQNEKTLRTENMEMRHKLDDRRVRIENAGSLAEAALSLNHIFEDTQESADQYLLNIREMSEKILSDAKAEAEEILGKARELLRETEEADEKVGKRIDAYRRQRKDFLEQAQAFLRDHPEFEQQLRENMEKKQVHQEEESGEGATYSEDSQ